MKPSEALTETKKEKLLNESLDLLKQLSKNLANKRFDIGQDFALLICCWNAGLSHPRESDSRFMFADFSGKIYTPIFHRDIKYISNIKAKLFDISNASSFGGLKKMNWNGVKKLIKEIDLDPEKIKELISRLEKEVS